MESKSSRIKELNKIVKVPKFFSIDSIKDFPILDRSKKYMVRSSSKDEDQYKNSNAGQFKTFGPLKYGRVKKFTKKLLKEVEEVIIQEFIEGKSGVIFCKSKNEMIVEYSNIFEGVTSGKIMPFVSLLPANLKKYDKLYQECLKIYQNFGACDIEFINIKQPSFVQVRPITKNANFDRNMINLKMELQELGEENWIENDFCKIIPEREHSSKGYLELYCNMMPRIFDKYFHKQIKLPKKCFLKISSQYFIAGSLQKQIKLNFLDIIKFSRLYIKKEKKFIKELESNDLDLLFENNLLLSLAYDSLKKDTIGLRGKYMEKIDMLLKKGSLNVDLESKKKIGNLIQIDHETKTWKNINYKESKGIVIVKGNFKEGPYFRFNGKVPPKGVILVTPQLYCEIGEYMDKLKGIICEGGAYTSHISILAREKNIPLKIQETKACRKYI